MGSKLEGAHKRESARARTELTHINLYSHITVLHSTTVFTGFSLKNLALFYNLKTCLPLVSKNPFWMPMVILFCATGILC
jgi:hypothetical protein